MSRFHFILLAFILLTLASCRSPINDGYTNKVSYAIGDSLVLALNATKPIKDYDIELTDVNGTVVKSYSANLFPQTPVGSQPYETGFGYEPNLSIAVPDLTSGVYLFGEDIPIVIKPKKTPDILILYSSNTENAYANSGGKSGYAYNSSDKKPHPILSFHRPMGLAFHSGEFLKWIHTQDQLDIGYICDSDMDDYSQIDGAKLLIIPGHSEYWTKAARKNFDRFVDAGNNALIISGNTMWWQVRYSEDKSQMICYKSFDKDPVSHTEDKTVNWPLAQLNYSVTESIGLDFVNGGFGKDEDQGWDGFKITNEVSPLLKGTQLKNGDILSIASDEYDGAHLAHDSISGTVHLMNDHHFHNYELIGYDLASRKPESNGAWVALQKTESSGVIINAASTDWCRKEGMLGKDSKTIKLITLNMIELLLNNDKSSCFTAP